MAKETKHIEKVSEEIIAENSSNQELLFLIRGIVGVLANKKHIVNFRGGGKVFGEMNFVNNKSNPASVMAENDVKMTIYKIGVNI